MAKIRKINVSEIEGNNPGDGSVLSAGTITMYEEGGDYFLRVHDGETDGGITLGGGTGDITFSGLDINGQATEGYYGLINLIPATTATGQFGSINFIDAGQFVRIYPTNEFDSPHIHIAAGLGANDAEGDIFLGDDEKYIQVNHNGVVSIRSNDYQENNAYVWQFRNDGRLELPGGGEIGLYGMGWTGLTNGVQGTAVNLAFLSNDEQNLRTELSSVYLNGDANSGYATINTGDTNASHQWTFDANGKLLLPENGNIAFNGGQISGGDTEIVTDGINSISLSAGGQMDVFGFPFNGPSRGQLTITGSISTTQALGTWYYEAVNTNAYRLYTDATYTTLVDASGWTAYNGGGSVAITKQASDNEVVINSNGYLTKFGTDGSLIFPDSSSQSSAAISIADLKTLVAAAASYEDFQTAIANLNS